MKEGGDGIAVGEERNYAAYPDDQEDKDIDDDNPDEKGGLSPK